MVSTTVHVVGKRGNLRIPVAMRRALGIKPGDKMAIALVDGEIRIRHVGSVVAHTAGSLKSHEPPETAERLRKIAEEVIAADVIQRGGT